jgi:hypothetical protein
MIIGAIGPWAGRLLWDGRRYSWFTVDGIEIGIGWVAIGAAIAGGLLFALARRSCIAGAFPVIAGLVTSWLVLSERASIAEPRPPCLNCWGPPRIEWGLELALAGSVSFALAGLVWAATPTLRAVLARGPGEPAVGDR